MFPELVVDGELDIKATGLLFDLVTPRFASRKYVLIALC